MRSDAGDGHGRDVDPADPAGVAQSRARAAALLRDAVSQLSRRGFSSSDPVADVVSDKFALLASAMRTPRGDTYEVMISANCHPEPLDSLAGVTLDLRVGPNGHFLALMDETGSASFSGIQPGKWRMQVLGSPRAARADRAFAMPSWQGSGALAASSAGDADARDFPRLVRAPDGLTNFTVTARRGEEALLEINVSADSRADTPFLVPVTYQQNDGREAVLLVAVDRFRRQLYSAVTLADFNPYGEWSVGDLFGPGLLSQWPASVVGQSVEAARAYHRASEIWQRLAELAPPPVADVIRGAVD